MADLSTAIELGFWLAERGRADPGLRKGGAKLHRGPRLISDPLIIPIPRQGSTPRVKGNSPNLRLCSPAFHCIEQQEFGRAPFRAGFSQHIGAEVVLYDGDTDAVNCFCELSGLRRLILSTTILNRQNEPVHKQKVTQ